MFKKRVQNKERDVRQGCTLSPLILNAYIQEATDTIRERIQIEVKVNDYKIDTLRFADNITILAENENDFRNIGTGDGKGFTYEN